MDVLIIGAGICGLTAAVGLRQQGHRVTLFEQSQLAVESGAAIFLPPNANGILRAYGFLPNEHGANTYRGHRHFTPSGTLIFEDLISEDEYKNPWELIRRSSLHAGLKSLATDPSRPGTPADIRTSSRVKSLDAATSSIVLEDGTEVRGDLLLGADGSKSVARAALGRSGPHYKLPEPFSSGKNAFRFLISREKLQSHPETATVYEQDGMLNAWFGKHVHLISYPCDHNKLINFVAIHPAEYSSADGNDYNSVGSIEILRSVFQGFEPAVQKIIDSIELDELKLYPLMDMKNLSTFVRDRLALIGDAAHPFLPYQGQGGAQAVEDAVSIAALLPVDTKPEDVPTRLKLYEVARKARVEEVQEKTRMTGAEIAPDVKLDFKAIRDYNFNHNEWEHSSGVLQKHILAFQHCE